MESPRHFLIFQVSDLKFALTIEHVVEILAHEEFMKLPCLPPHIPHVIKYRDRALPVLDLQRFWKLKASESDGLYLHRVIVVRAAQMQVGLLAHRIAQIAEWNAQKCHAPETLRDPEILPFVRSEYEHELGLLLCLDLKLLLEKAKVS